MTMMASRDYDTDYTTDTPNTEETVLEMCRRALLLHNMEMEGWVDAAYDALDMLISCMEYNEIDPFGPLITVDQERWDNQDMSYEETLVYLERLINAIRKYVDYVEPN